MFLTFDDTREDSLEELEQAKELISPVMIYVRECKRIFRFHNIAIILLGQKISE